MEGRHRRDESQPVTKPERMGVSPSKKQEGPELRTPAQQDTTSRVSDWPGQGETHQSPIPQGNQEGDSPAGNVEAAQRAPGPQVPARPGAHCADQRTSRASRLSMAIRWAETQPCQSTAGDRGKWAASHTGGRGRSLCRRHQAAHGSTQDTCSRLASGLTDTMEAPIQALERTEVRAAWTCVDKCPQSAQRGHTAEAVLNPTRMPGADTSQRGHNTSHCGPGPHLRQVRSGLTCTATPCDF